jgi:sn1-specific diacylglycerol lipase
LLFFGVPLPPSKHNGRNEEQAKGEEEETIARLVLDAEAQEVDDAVKQRNAALPHDRKWWDIIMGKHDQEIIEHYATLDQPTAKITATIGDHEQIPRFWVLVDHSRREVILILRGTYSLNELAAVSCSFHCNCMATNSSTRTSPVKQPSLSP